MILHLLYRNSAKRQGHSGNDSPYLAPRNLLVTLLSHLCLSLRLRVDLGKESRDSFAHALQPVSPSRVALGHTGRQITGAKLAITLRGHSKPLLSRLHLYRQG